MVNLWKDGIRSGDTRCDFCFHNYDDYSYTSDKCDYCDAVVCDNCCVDDDNLQNRGKKEELYNEKYKNEDHHFIKCMFCEHDIERDLSIHDIHLRLIELKDIEKELDEIKEQNKKLKVMLLATNLGKDILTKISTYL